MMFLFAMVRAGFSCLLHMSGLSLLPRSILILMAMAVASTGMAGTVTYVYDEADRIIGVVDGSGQAAQYSYDNAGNLLSVTSYAASTVTILEFTPNSGAAGNTITVAGSGFSSTPSQNTVKFNGLAATVLTATATQLTVRVPVGVTTGPISVTSPGGTATSSTNFVVALANGTPTISGFTPDMGSPGTLVTVTGTNFDTNPGATKVRFNQTLAGLSSITPTSLVATVPNGATSGRIQVTTVAGVASSTADFIVPPAGINAADIISKARIAVGGASANLNINAQNKVGLLLFDGNVGQYLTVQLASFITNPTGSSVAYELYSPRGVKIATGSVSASLLSIHLPQLPTTGTYSLYFKPGTATAAFSAALLANKVVLTNGANLSDSVTVSGQTTRFVFAGTAGQNLGLGISALSLSTTYADVRVYKPDGTQVTGGQAYCYVSTGGCGLNLSALPVSGTYSVVVTPVSGGTGSFTATLSSDATGSLVAGTAFNLSLARAGKNGRLSFSGTAGDQRGLTLSSVVITGSTGSVTATIYKPDGTTLTSVSAANGATGIVDLPVLPTTGTYTVFIDPPDKATASLSVLLTADVTVPLVLDGAASNVSITQAGQTARLTFTGTAGQNLGLGISALSLSTTYADVRVYKPDGTQVTGGQAYCYVSTGGCGLNLSALPVSGTYSAVVAPVSGGTGSFTATLSSDVAGTLTIGTAYSLSLSRAGQNGRLAFSGIAGDTLGLALNAVTVMPATAGSGIVTVFNPDGSQLTSTSFSNGNVQVSDLPVLPATGTYTLIVDMPNAATGAVTLLLHRPVQVPLVLDAAPLPVTLLTGQHGRFAFTLTSTQNLGLGVTAVSTTPSGGSVNVQVRQPDGTFISCGSFTTGGSCNLMGFVAGTYTVFVEPGVNAANLTLALSSDVTGTLIANGSAQIFSTTRVGQNGAYTLVATAGQQLALSWSGSTFATGLVSIIAPNGSALFSNVPLTSTNVLEWTAVAGTYRVLIDPSGTSTGSVQLQLSTDLTGALTIDGAPTAVSLLAGQNARLSFAGTAGQNLGLGISSYASAPAGGTANVSVLDTNGAILASTTLTGSGTSLNATTLPASGTYTVVVDPVGAASASFNVTLSQDIVGTLAPNGPVASFSSALVGQNGRYTFSGTAGQGVSMLLANSTLGASTLTVSGPNGVSGSTNLSQTSSFLLELGALTATGIYTAFVDPAGIQTGGVTLAMVSDQVGTLVVNSPTATTVSTTAGQNARYTFAGSAGARYAVAVTGISTLPAGVGVSVTVLDPAGNNVKSCGTLTVDTVCDVPALASTGNYTVLVDPPATSTATVSFGVKSEVLGTVTVDSGAATTTTFTAGQNVRLIFNNSTAGATLKLTVSGLTLAPSGSQAYLRVLDPAGVNIFGSTYWVFTTAGYSIDLPALSSIGNYTIEFDPLGLAAGSASFAVTASSSGAISIDGPAVTVNLVSNQQPALNFMTTVPNQAITLSFSAMSTTPAGGVLRYSMSGATSWATNITAPGINIPQLPLATVGSYSMTLLPQSAFSGTVTVALVNDQTGTLTIGGAAVTHTPARVAQSKRITFTNSTANRVSTIRINSSQWTSGTWWLIPPSGGAAQGTFPATTNALNFTVTLGATGTYTLIMVPAGTNVGTASVSVL